jgi:hypothetical protein
MGARSRHRGIQHYSGDRLRAAAQLGDVVAAKFRLARGARLGDRWLRGVFCRARAGAPAGAARDGRRAAFQSSAVVGRHRELHGGRTVARGVRRETPGACLRSGAALRAACHRSAAAANRRRREHRRSGERIHSRDISRQRRVVAIARRPRRRSRQARKIAGKTKSCARGRRSSARVALDARSGASFIGRPLSVALLPDARPRCIAG